MANGELCKYCGNQEAAHDLGEAFFEKGRRKGKRCMEFVSEVEHKENCPILGCDGDCDAAMRRHQDELERRYGRIEDML